MTVKIGPLSVKVTFKTRIVRLKEVIYSENFLLAHKNVSVILRCPSICLSYKGIPIKNLTYLLLGHIRLSILERSYGMFALIGFTVPLSYTPISYCKYKEQNWHKI